MTYRSLYSTWKEAIVVYLSAAPWYSSADWKEKKHFNQVTCFTERDMKWHQYPSRNANQPLVRNTFLLSDSTAQREQGSPHSRSFKITHNDTPQQVGFLCTTDRPVAEIFTRQHTQNTHKRQTSKPPTKLEPTIPASKGSRPSRPLG